MKKFFRKIYHLTVFILSILFLTYFSFSFWDDLLSEAFDPADSVDAVIDFWETKDDVWHTFLRKSRSFSRWQWFFENAPVIVKIVKIILKMTVVLSVTMVIFYSVKFMIQVFNWNDYKSASAKKDLINLFIWLLIALFSITAVRLVASIPKKTLNDISYYNNALLQDFYL